jgi:four helix bundle protein
MSLVLTIYKSTDPFPMADTYGLVSQLRRAAVSIPSRTAEGQARLTTAGFKQSLGQARGSLRKEEMYILQAQESATWSTVKATACWRAQAS